jgi:hypothetical protein
LLRAACSRRLPRAVCADAADTEKRLTSLPDCGPKAEMGVIPSSGSAAAWANVAVLVSVAGVGLRCRTGAVGGADANAERRLGAIVIVMACSLSDVNR